MYEAIDVMNLSHWPLQEEFLADKEGVTCISWNKSRFDAPMILVGGNSDVVKVWGYNNNYRRWQIVAELNGHSDSIHDVCWAPNMGRSYHLLATASKDRTFRIWKLKLQEGLLQGEVEEVAKKHHHDSELWRVEWNITGTMLASSGDDGIVRMWKSDHQGNWACVNTICGDLSSNIQTIKASASAAAAANASTEGAAGGSDGTHIVNPIQSLGRGGAGGLSGTTGANARLSGLNLNVPALGGATKGSSSIGGPSGPLGSSTNGQNSLVLPGGINPSGVNPVNAGSVVIGPGGQHHSGPTAAAVTAAATAAVLANMNLNSVNIP
jgi:nucleoporin SEH1